MFREKISRAGLLLPVMLMAMFVLILIPGLAHAQAAPPASMTPGGLYETFIEGKGDNYTMMLLKQIFGSPIFAPDGETGITRTLFGDVVGYFNAAVLVVGGIMFLNNLATGTLQSAHEGEVLGRSWSSLWAPLRSIMAIALLIPIPNYNGYNTAQLFTALMVKNATTFATSVWSISATNITTGVIPVSPPPANLPKGLVSQIYLMELCSVILNDQFEMGIPKNPNSDRISKKKGDGETGNSANPYNLYQERHSYNRVDSAGKVKETEICGYYQSPAIPDVINNRFSDPAKNQMDLGTVLGASGSQTIRDNFRDLHADVLSKISEQMAAIAKESYAAYKAKQPSFDMSKPLEQALVEARSKLDVGYTKLLTMIGTGADKNKQIRQMMVDRISNQCEEGRACSGEGWIGAGSWYMIMARINNELSTLFSAESEAKSSREAGAESNPTKWFRDNSKQNALAAEYRAAYDYGTTQFNNAANMMATQGWNIDYATATNIGDSLTGAESNKRGSDGDINQMRNVMMNIVTTIVSAGNDDPMIKIVNFGQALLPIGAIMVGADLFAPGNVLSTGGTVIATAGATMAVVLPLMPFVFWVMAVTGYLLLVVEAFIAVNLWALGMLKMDGEGIFGPQSREGWLMILALMFTPVLMVAGFFVGMIIFRITATIISMGLTVSMAGIFANANAFFVLFSTVVIVVFMTMIYLTVLERSFSLVAEFPNRVLRWMGAQVNLDTSGANSVRAAAIGAVASTSGVMGSLSKNVDLGKGGRAAAREKFNRLKGGNAGKEKEKPAAALPPPTTAG